MSIHKTSNGNKTTRICLSFVGLEVINIRLKLRNVITVNICNAVMRSGKIVEGFTIIIIRCSFYFSYMMHFTLYIAHASFYPV